MQAMDFFDDKFSVTLQKKNKNNNKRSTPKNKKQK